MECDARQVHHPALAFAALVVALEERDFGLALSFHRHTTRYYRAWRKFDHEELDGCIGFPTCGTAGRDEEILWRGRWPYPLLWTCEAKCVVAIRRSQEAVLVSGGMIF